MDLATLALYSAVASAGLGVYSAYSQAQANKKAYEYQAQVAANNAKIAEWQAEDAITRGQTAEAQHRLRVAQLAGSQRASLASRGLDLGEGSPLDILTGTAFMGEIDALAIRDNAQREAWAYRQQGSDYTANATLFKMRADSESPFLSAAGSLLGSAGKVADRWDVYKATKKR